MASLRAVIHQSSFAQPLHPLPRTAVHARERNWTRERIWRKGRSDPLSLFSDSIAGAARVATVLLRSPFPIVASSTRALSDNLMSPQCRSMCDWHQQQQCNLAPTPNDAKPRFILFSASVTRCVQRDVIVHPIPHPVVFRWRFLEGNISGAHDTLVHILNLIHQS
jgi:hypothetical protein